MTDEEESCGAELAASAAIPEEFGRLFSIGRPLPSGWWSKLSYSVRLHERCSSTPSSRRGVWTSSRVEAVGLAHASPWP